ncbi:MAG: DUF4344 domain-containing metallopeptidase [Pyrinomonadaceae bacterium]
MISKKNLWNLISVAFILFVIIGCTCNSTDDETGNNRVNSEETNNSTQNTGENADNGDFVVEYVDVQNPRYRSINKSMRENGTLDKAANKLNRTLNLPYDITLRAKDCNEVNAFYNPEDHSITVCYELMEFFYKTFRGAGDDEPTANRHMNSAITFIFLHELGHGLIDAYKLPITANEEDAADRCSSYICIEELGDEGVQAVITAAQFFAMQTNANSNDARVMADEHLMDGQRFFTSLCMIYGSNPNKYSDFVTKGMLPEARAVRCPDEYRRTSDSWQLLLKPWRKQ